MRRDFTRERRFYLQYNHKMQIIGGGRYRTLVLRYLKRVLAARVSNKMQIREKRDVTKEKIRNRICEPGKSLRGRSDEERQDSRESYRVIFFFYFFTDILIPVE